MTDTPPPGPDDSFGHAANGDGPADRTPGAAGAADDTGSTRDVDRAWAEVGDRFADLGRRIKEQQQQRATPPDAASGASSGDDIWDTPTADETPGPERHRESGAARQVVDALDEAFSALGDTVRDESFKREARGTLNALGAALGATFTELGEQLQQRFDQPDDRKNTSG